MRIRMLFRSTTCDQLFPMDWNAEPHRVGACIDRNIQALFPAYRLVRVERLDYPYDIPSVESLIANARVTMCKHTT